MAFRVRLVKHGVRTRCRLGAQLGTGLSACGRRNRSAISSEVGILTDQELGTSDGVERLVPSGTLGESRASGTSSRVGGRRRALSGPSPGPGTATHDGAELGILDPGESTGLVGFEVANSVLIVVHSADACPFLSVAHLYALLDSSNVLKDLGGWAPVIRACAYRIRSAARASRGFDLSWTRSDGRLRRNSSGEGDDGGECRVEAVESGHCWSSVISNEK